MEPRRALACALLIVAVAGMGLASRPIRDEVVVMPDVMHPPDDVLATFTAECEARVKTSVFGLLKRGVEIKCFVTAVSAA